MPACGFPLAWCFTEGRGRAFYTALGHFPGAWESLATWQDKAGTAWVFASIAGAVLPNAKFATTNGSAPHGSIVAFKLEDKDGHPALTPIWVSHDLKNPLGAISGYAEMLEEDAGEIPQEEIVDTIFLPLLEARRPTTPR